MKFRFAEKRLDCLSLNQWQSSEGNEINSIYYFFRNWLLNNDSASLNSRKICKDSKFGRTCKEKIIHDFPKNKFYLMGAWLLSYQFAYRYLAVYISKIYFGQPFPVTTEASILINQRSIDVCSSLLYLGKYFAESRGSDGFDYSIKCICTIYLIQN